MNDITSLLVGSSTAMKQLRAKIKRIAESPVPVLIQGPTGSGKELVACALHQLSKRRGRLIALNICAISETMFEDALFGHVRGAFTGALTSSAGYALEADGGTLFLDEISSLAPMQQAKLLRLIETRRFRPIGAKEDRTSDFRLITASNEPISELADNGSFRPDLYHRIAAMTIVVPSLHARLEDMEELTEHFLLKYAEIVGRRVECEAGVIEMLCTYDWPGNVRELRSLLEVAIAMSDEGTLNIADVRAQLEQRTSARSRAQGNAVEREQMITLLVEHQGDTRRLASALGVDRATVYRRLKDLGIPTPKQRRDDRAFA